jgi:hypothetical protein
LIRIHREDVAFEIARRAAERTRLEGARPELIPLKILVPLLEKGSQEAADDDFMIDLWANLLAAAASGKDVQPRFVSIIGEPKRGAGSAPSAHHFREKTPHDNWSVRC